MKIGIIGLGMIGGSLGIDLRRLGHQVLGVCRQEQTCQLALTCGAVDRVSTDLALLSAADVIFICTPLDAIQPTVEQLIPHLQPSTILTDVGSVKTSITKAIASLWSNFIGGHPITTEAAKHGIAVAKPHLFAEITYVLTPIEATPIEAVKTVVKIVQSLGSQVLCCRPEDHDRAVALFYQLPSLVGSSLIAACLSEPNGTILESYPELERSQQFDKARLLRTLQHHLCSLDQMIAQIEQEDWEGLEQHLTKFNKLI
jgi:arogenate dehydrogenase (NADP+)